MSGQIGSTGDVSVPTAEDVPRIDGMPMLGFGTWQLSESAECVEAVTTALDIGYRHIDTAQAYDNEVAVGDAIDRSSVDRDELFLATKIWVDNLDYEDTLETAHRSLDRLGTEYVDLLYVHWPAGEYEAEATLEAFDELAEAGVTERLGVSNFEPDHLAEACTTADTSIFANQFECHPLLKQQRILEACDDHDVHPVAYSPLARQRITDVPEVNDVGAKHEASPAQVSLAWLRQRGITAIPKATSEEHIRDNWQSLTLHLDEADEAKLDAIDGVERQVDPGFAPWNASS